MRIFKNSRGLTVMELLIGMAISSIAAMVALNFTLFFYQSQQQIIARMSAEEGLIRASYVLQRLFSTAAHLDRVAVPIVSGTNITGGSGNGRGKFLEFTYDRFSAIPAAEVIVGAFQRDVSNQDTTAHPRVRLTPVMITYLAPTTTKSGVIFIANQNAANHPAAPTTLSRSYDGVFFEKIVEFGLNQVFTTTNSLGVVKPIGLNIMIKARHFIKNSDPNTWVFCPQWDIVNATAGCTNVDSYVDLLREVRVTMVNQVVESNASGLRVAAAFERALGNIYLFPVGINR